MGHRGHIKTHPNGNCRINLQKMCSQRCISEFSPVKTSRCHNKENWHEAQMTQMWWEQDVTAPSESLRILGTTEQCHRFGLTGILPSYVFTVSLPSLKKGRKPEQRTAEVHPQNARLNPEQINKSLLSSFLQSLGTSCVCSFQSKAQISVCVQMCVNIL